MTVEGLRARWEDDLAGTEFGARSAAFADLVTRYGEAHRRYHTVEHLVAVHGALDDLGGAVPPAVRLAAWYHDAIYDTTAPDNEARSAELARTVLTGLGVDGATVAETARLIGLTREHAVPDGDTAGAVLVDADLSILGTDAATYDRYVAAVRAEYGQVGDELWRVGRGAVLGSLLERPVLFHTPAGRARWEAPARANLRRERDALSA